MRHVMMTDRVNHRRFFFFFQHLHLLHRKRAAVDNILCVFGFLRYTCSAKFLRRQQYRFVVYSYFRLYVCYSVPEKFERRLIIITTVCCKSIYIPKCIIVCIRFCRIIYTLYLRYNHKRTTTVVFVSDIFIHNNLLEVYNIIHILKRV